MTTIEIPQVAQLDVPAAFAPEADRVAIQRKLGVLKDAGWARPQIREITKLSDSQVWRAQQGKAHTVELPVWNAFFALVDSGEVKPVTRGRKATAKEMLAQMQKAAQLLGSVAQLTKAADIKKVVAEALALVPDAIKNPPVEDEAHATRATDGEANADAPAEGDAPQA